MCNLCDNCFKNIEECIEENKDNSYTNFEGEVIWFNEENRIIYETEDDKVIKCNFHLPLDLLKKMWLFTGNYTQEPCIIYTPNYNRYNWLVCNKVNTGISFFITDFDKLKEVDFKELDELKKVYYYNENKKAVEIYESELKKKCVLTDEVKD